MKIGQPKNHHCPRHIPSQTSGSGAPEDLKSRQAPVQAIAVLQLALEGASPRFLIRASAPMAPGALLLACICDSPIGQSWVTSLTGLTSLRVTPGQLSRPRCGLTLRSDTAGLPVGSGRGRGLTGEHTCTWLLPLLALFPQTVQRLLY